jgi:glutamyl-tRNA synthetase
MSQPIRVRFAPSPTGLLHVGGARTALFNWFYARRFGGTFILRIEDTDTERSRKEFEEEILFSMKWLGLNWDEGPFYQSKRFDLYRDYAEKLLAKGHAYKCFTTTEELEAMRERAKAEGRRPGYDRTWRDRTDHPSDKPYVIRFKAPLDGDTIVPDSIYGEVRFANAECDDFVILRSNGAPTYNFTVVVDDIDMKISHVIRGDDHLNNTPKQILVMKAFGWTPPTYAHVPMILGPDKSKLSKRHGAVAVSQYRTDGYLPEAMQNALVRLGWAHGDDEILTAAQVEKIFDLSGCGKSAAVFDKGKLDSLNQHYLKQKSLSQIVDLVQEIFQVDLKPFLETDGRQALLKALIERSKTLKDVVTQTQHVPLNSSFVVSPDSILQETASESAKVMREMKVDALHLLIQDLSALPASDWNPVACSSLFKAVVAKAGVKMPDLAKPTRILLTGTLMSPDIGLVAAALGRDLVLKRFEVLKDFEAVQKS